MAGGYKHGKYSFTGGTIGSTDAERCATVLKGCANVLLGLNVGWSLDTSLNATVDDYTSATGDSYCKTTSSSSFMQSPCYMLFFTSTSGAKLCLGYRYGFYMGTNPNSTYGTRTALDNNWCAGNIWHYGLFVSIIPPGVNDTFSTSSPYRPDSATLFIGTARTSYLYGNSGYGTSYRVQSFANYDSTSLTYSYDIISNGLNVIVLNHSNVSGESDRYGGYICGRLVTSFINAGDSNGYGTLALADSGYNRTQGNGYQCEFYIGYNNIANGINVETNYYTNAGEYSYYYESGLAPCQSVKKADNSAWITGFFTNAGSSSGSNLYSPRITANTFNLTSNISAANRWVPIIMHGYATAGTLAQYGVTNETCLKGWIDPDLARIVNNNSTYHRGQTFDNGNLVYIGAGLAIGWDPSNTTSIF